MLINTPRYMEVLFLLAKAPFKFYLTGSRYFGYHTLESDWDFFVSYEAGDGSALVNWLRNSGFHRESGFDYNTTDITEVWKHGVTPIHVQVVEDAELKSAAQDILSSDPRLIHQMRKLSKEGRKALWTAVLASFVVREENALRSIVDSRRS